MATRTSRAVATLIVMALSAHGVNIGSSRAGCDGGYKCCALTGDIRVHPVCVAEASIRHSGFWKFGKLVDLYACRYFFVGKDIKNKGRWTAAEKEYRQCSSAADRYRRYNNKMYHEQDTDPFHYVPPAPPTFTRDGALPLAWLSVEFSQVFIELERGGMAEIFKSAIDNILRASDQPKNRLRVALLGGRKSGKTAFAHAVAKESRAGQSKRHHVGYVGHYQGTPVDLQDTAEDALKLLPITAHLVDAVFVFIAGDDSDDDAGIVNAMTGYIAQKGIIKVAIQLRVR